MKSTAIAGAGIAIDSTGAFAEPRTAGAHPIDSDHSESASASEEFTRGIGAYPGDFTQNFSPELALDAPTYRNLALLRPAYHSSSYDFNLTAQLVTDGIKETRLPRWVVVSDPLRGPLPKEERETVLDHNPMVAMELKWPNTSIDIEFGGGDTPLEVDRCNLIFQGPLQIPASALKISIFTSDDGRDWKKVAGLVNPKPAPTAGFPPDLVSAGSIYMPVIALDSPSKSPFYRFEFATDPADVDPKLIADSTWNVTEVAFFRGDQRVEIGGPYGFTSAWMSAGMAEEWVYVDLGARFEFDRVKLFWIARAAEGFIQVSDDAQHWTNLQSLSGRTGLVDDVQLGQPATGRYVRVLMTRPSSPYGYILSELEVYGHGGLVAKPKPRDESIVDNRVNLAGGAWRIQRGNFIHDPGEALSKTGYDDASWLVGTVPGTALTSYLNAGAIPDPNFGQNQLHISDSYFYSDFWYRTEFSTPKIESKQSISLTFDGINWKAGVFLNGELLGSIDGGFIRGHFDVTKKLLAGKPNALAIRIEKNATPGSAKQKTFESSGKNGGALGADNPTYHASIGWDWIPTIRGRNTGIWGDVFLSVQNAVTIENHFVSTKLPLPDTSIADLTIEFDLVNHEPHPTSGVVRGRIGDANFNVRVSLAASERKRVKLDPSTQPSLHIKNPKLWWPAGYGDPTLHDCSLSFEASGNPICTRNFKVGLRQMTYSEEGGALRIWINGRRFIARGGNWGFGESMLRYREREYDAAVRYHREMNFTMIRNWVGQIGDEALYDACDRHGVMVWHDFWLANPWDGPEPDDDALFLSNARDFILRIRNHCSIGLFCGRNEGFPPPALEKGIRQILGDLHPDLHYIPSSADDVVSGHGPYAAMPLSYYFKSADSKLHSEIGAPNIPPMESIRLMMPETSMWPQGLDWGLHDFCLQGAQGGGLFRSIIENQYGGASTADEWVRLAQFVNYDTYRAMFEAQSRFRMGVLLWMSHPCWPSFVWQTYDYFFEPTAAYFGCKKGSEPLHIQWNRLEDTIEMVNYSAGHAANLTAQVEILNMDGKQVARHSAPVDVTEDSTTTCFRMQYPAGLSPVHFLRLSLKRGSDTLSSNFYWRGTYENDFRAIRDLPRAEVKVQTSVQRAGDLWRLTTELHNADAAPALMVRIKAIREKTGDRIVPAIYSDNYIALMPGESTTLTTEVRHADTRGEKPTIVLA